LRKKSDGDVEREIIGENFEKKKKTVERNNKKNIGRKFLGEIVEKKRREKKI
jgi:hypothetical protein